VIALALAAAAAAGVEVRPYGTLASGEPVQEYTLTNARGTSVRFLSLGGIITQVNVPDRRGRRANVVLGFPSLADYEAKNKDYAHGAILGRYAGRIANARFTIDRREVRLKPDDGPNALHGGADPGFEAKVWSVEPLRQRGVAGAVLRYTSPAGEQDFPGTIAMQVTYRLYPDDALRIDYAATTNAPTLINPTNHSYFNLAGNGRGTILDHRLTLRSNAFVELAAGIPTGRLPSVAGTPFDFRTARPLRQCLEPHPQLAGHRGCNHAWPVAGGMGLRPAARLNDPGSGRTLEVLTDEPAIQVYTGNWMPGTDRGSGGELLKPHSGVALETQHFPDSPNRPEFPSTVLRPGETFHSATIFRFGVER
jgi:aldose 1-epimerase